MKTILLIEDSDDIRETTAEILELASYNVLMAENGKIGVEIAQQSKPDLVICDIMMPILDGYGVLHIFSQNPTLQNIPWTITILFWANFSHKMIQNKVISQC